MYGPCGAAIGLLLTASASITCEAQTIINSPPTAVPDGFELMDGDRLFVGQGGEVGQGVVATAGSLVNVSGGYVGGLLADQGSLVEVSGGVVRSIRANYGSSVSVSDGGIVSRFRAAEGSDVDIMGGVFGGGSIEELGFVTEPGSRVRISGGLLESGPGAFFGGPQFAPGTVELIGGQFQLNGVDYTAGSVSTRPGDVFSGTFADGSAFIFNYFGGLDSVTLVQRPLPPIAPSPRVVDSRQESGPYGVRSGETVIVRPGGQLADETSVVGATLSVEGGEVGFGAQVFAGVVNLSDGVLGAGFNALGGSVVNISGGTVLANAFGGGFRSEAGSVVNISGGVIQDAGFGGGFSAGPGSVINISGGVVSSGSQFGGFVALEGSVVNVFGGVVKNGLRVNPGSEFNLYGTEFFLGDVAIESLSPGEVFEITVRDVPLRGRLADGTLFTYDLNPNDSGLGTDFFSPEAQLTVTLIPEPHASALAVFAIGALRLTRRRAK